MCDELIRFELNSYVVGGHRPKKGYSGIRPRNYYRKQYLHILFWI